MRAQSRGHHLHSPNYKYELAIHEPARNPRPVVLPAPPFVPSRVHIFSFGVSRYGLCCTDCVVRVALRWARTFNPPLVCPHTHTQPVQKLMNELQIRLASEEKIKSRIKSTPYRGAASLPSGLRPTPFLSHLGPKYYEPGPARFSWL